MKFDGMRENDIQAIRELGQAEIVVGIPSFNNADTISYVVEQAAAGLKQCFPGKKAAILNSDGGSKDSTRENFMNTPVPEGINLYSFEYQGPAGKGSAFRALFYSMKLLGAEYCVVLDSDLRSVSPDWIERLTGPIVNKGYDYVTPMYMRHKFDGTITNSIAFPVTSMLYGKPVRQPIGGDFGFRSNLCDLWLSMPIWETEAARFGIDIFMTTTAICEGYKVCQSYMGAKIHDVKDPASSLGPMFFQVISTMFYFMNMYRDKWSSVDAFSEVFTYGDPELTEPEPVQVTRPLMISKFQNGFKENSDYYSSFLNSDTFRLLETASNACEESYEFTLSTWIRTLFEFAVEFQCTDNRKKLIDSLIPIYFGRTASLVSELSDLSSKDAECTICSWPAKYIQNKPYLEELWNSKEIKELELE